ncbi:MAG TPA: HIT family protein [Gammaproteobacteria bacterium]|jgi:histidine triad (HIT) family protein|nr:HIT family protein [Gammaproteobacteria bacterium]
MHKDECVICAIVNKSIKSYIVFENNHLIAFLDHRPLFLGHCLLAPKNHIQTLYDLPTSLLETYFFHLQKIGKAVENGMSAAGSFIAMNNIISQSIPHLHTHIVPRNPKDGLKGFFWPRQKYLDEHHMLEVQTEIKHYLEKTD